MATQAVILFDGVCNLCNASVQFVIKQDKQKYFSFAPLQGEFGQKVLQEHNLAHQNFDSFILLDKGKVYTKSSAALHVSKHLKFPFPLLYLLLIIPAFIRNFVYDIVARYRYKWFGKKDSCMIPTPDLKDRFID